MIDWGTIIAVSGVVVTGVGTTAGMLRRMRNNDFAHIRTELDHLAKDIEELKNQDRCARKEHDDIRREMSQRSEKIYQELHKHTQWHLDHPDET